MLYSPRTVLWILVHFGPWVDAANPAPQTRHYYSNITSSQTVPPPMSLHHFTTEPNSVTTNYFHSTQRPRTGTLWGQFNDTQTPETSTATNTTNYPLPSKWANATCLTSSGPVTRVPVETWTTSTLPRNNATKYNDCPTTTQSNCLTLAPGEPVTSWSIVPNTTTITITLGANTTSFYSSTPEFTPPVYCSETTSAAAPLPTLPFYITPPHTTKSSTDSAVASSSTTYVPAFTFSATASVRLTITVITTSKNPVVVTTTASVPHYLDPGATDKQSVNPSTYTDTHKWSPFDPPPAQTNPPLDVSTIQDDPPAQTTPPDAPPPAQTTPPNAPPPVTTIRGGSPPRTTAPPRPVTTTRNGDHSATTPITQIVDGITVVVSPTQVIIGTQIISIGGPPKTITQGSDTFTIGPSQVIGPSLVVNIPTFTSKSGGMFQETPKPSTVQGIPVQVGPTRVVVGGSTFDINPNLPPRTVVVKGQTLSIGPGGVGFSGTTITTPPNLPTNVVIIDGEAFSAIGSSAVVIRGSTFYYGPGSAPQTVVLNGEVITVAPRGVFFDGSTIGQVPALQTISLDGGDVITLGSAGIVHDGTTIGFEAAPRTTVIDGENVTIGSAGIILHGTTIGAASSPQTIALHGDGITVGKTGVSYDGTTIGFSETPQTVTLGGEVLTIGPTGVIHHGTTILGAADPTATQYGLAGGLSISEIGSTLAVIDGHTITLGPGVTPFTTEINGYTITAGSEGLTVGGATLTAPFNPVTQAVTAGGITFSQIGSSLVVIGSKTFTIGPGSPHTTDVYNGLTISLGPGGVGFSSTTYTAVTTAKATGKKKNGAGRLRPVYGVLGMCMGICICCFV